MSINDYYNQNLSLPSNTLDNITISSTSTGHITYDPVYTYTYATAPSILDVNGNANFEGDIKIKGKSLTETLDNIEKRLAILHPNIELEEKWERLKALGDMYRELEKEIIEKEELWKIIKK